MIENLKQKVATARFDIKQKANAKNTFTEAEDKEIKKLLAIARAVSKEKKIYIRETLRMYYGFYNGKLGGVKKALTLDNYDEFKRMGIIKMK